MLRNPSTPVATPFGIPLHLHWSAGLTALLVGLSAPSVVGIGGNAAASLLVGALAVALLGLSLVAHEYAHALVARRRGIAVRKVQMWALGGMAELEHEPRTWRDELAVAVVGPLTSLGIGAVAGAGALGLALVGGTVPAALLAWTAVVNVGLGVFNMLPGAPLDGGRVLAALVWWRTGKRLTALRVAGTSGTVVGALLIAVGAWTFVGGNGGLFTAFIGWFIMSAARRARAQAIEAERLDGIRVGDVAGPLPLAVRDDLTVDELVRTWLPATERRGDTILLVDETGKATGVVPLSAVDTVAPMQAGLPLSALAIPATVLGVVRPTADLGDAVASSPSGFILVSEPERVVGFISPLDLRRLMARLTPGAGGAA